MGFADTWGAAVGGGAQIFGAKEQNIAARHERQAMNRFTERMSNTAHEREVADLRKAGLNPILSANAGASTPGGGMAPVVSETAGAVNTALQVEAQKSNINLQDAQSAKLQSETHGQNATNVVKGWDAFVAYHKLSAAQKATDLGRALIGSAKESFDEQTSAKMGQQNLKTLRAKQDALKKHGHKLGKPLKYDSPGLERKSTDHYGSGSQRHTRAQGATVRSVSDYNF